jgi:hypothetical protein
MLGRLSEHLKFSLRFINVALSLRFINILPRRNIAPFPTQLPLE